MVNVKEGITVGDFIELLKPFENMRITFSKTNYDAPYDHYCDCAIGIVGNSDGGIELNIELDK